MSEKNREFSRGFFIRQAMKTLYSALRFTILVENSKSSKTSMFTGTWMTRFLFAQGFVNTVEKFNEKMAFTNRIVFLICGFC